MSGGEWYVIGPDGNKVDEHEDGHPQVWLT